MDISVHLVTILVLTIIIFILIIGVIVYTATSIKKDVKRAIDLREKSIKNLLEDIIQLIALIKEKIDLMPVENRKLLKDLFESELKIIAHWLHIKDDEKSK